MLQMEVRDLVDTIHKAAQDPNVVALYGIFGNGFEFKSGGWGHLDEVRSALKSFGETKLGEKDEGTNKETFAYAVSSRCGELLVPHAVVSW